MGISWFVFSKIYINVSWCIWELYKNVSSIPARYLTAWVRCNKDVIKTKVKLYLLTHINMLLMVEKGIKRGICHAIHWYVKYNNKYMKDYDKNKEP